LARIRDLDLDDVTVVARAMRECDRREIFATRWDECPEGFARDCVSGLSLGVVIANDAGVPIAVVGALEMWPGVWSVCMFATDRWLEVASSATRFVRERLMQALLRLGAHRAECRSAADHVTAHRWLEYLGARHESTHAGYGKQGEIFFGYSWRIDDVRRTLCTAEGSRSETRTGAGQDRCGG
jgi:hypothetical protein